MQLGNSWMHREAPSVAYQVLQHIEFRIYILSHAEKS